MLRSTLNLKPRLWLVQATIQQKATGLNAWLAAILERTTPFEVTALMTLILLFRFAGSDWFIEGPISLLTVAALLHRPWLRSHNFWFITATFLLAGNYYMRFTIDNHKYLMTYWVIAICAVLLLDRPQFHLARAAKVLIGLTFFFATLWKLITPDFMDGTFFTHQFLTDDRFQNAAEFFGGVGPDLTLRNDQAMHMLLAYDSQLTQVQLYGHQQVQAAAQLMTWWTFLIEGGLAILFLLPTTRWSYRLRSLALLLFLVTTYTNAPVIGFGWLLAVMGLAQSEEADHPLRFGFILAFLLIWVYSMPWSDLSYGLFNTRLPLAR